MRASESEYRILTAPDPSLCFWASLILQKDGAWRKLFVLDPPGDPGKNSLSSMHFLLCTSFCPSAKRRLGVSLAPSVESSPRTCQPSYLIRFGQEGEIATQESTALFALSLTWVVRDLPAHVCTFLMPSAVDLHLPSEKSAPAKRTRLPK